jgi:hypothetical protein
LRYLRLVCLPRFALLETIVCLIDHRSAANAELQVSR